MIIGGDMRASLDTLDDPEASLARLFSRVMETYDGAGRLAVWEREMLGATAKERRADFQEAVGWTRDLAAHVKTPRAHLMLGIVLGEAGRTDDLAALVRSASPSGDPWEPARRVLTAAYMSPVARRAVVDRDARSTVVSAADLRVARALLDEPWFADTLSLRLARATGDAAAAAAARGRLDTRGARLIERMRVVWYVRTLMLVLGLGVLLWLANLRWRRLPFPIVGLALIPPLWDWRRGVVALLCGGTVWLGVTLAATYVGLDVVARATFPTSTIERIIEVGAVAVGGIAFWFFASRFLFRSSGQTTAAALGLSVNRPSLAALAGLALAVVTLDWFALSGLERIADYFPDTSSWVETFVEDIVFGRGWTCVLTAVEIVVIAAVLEEFVFRGLLFNTLRRRFPFWFAAVVASLVFAGLHGYGWLGTAQIVAAGLLFAWAFESSGSLWTPILAHALYNGTVLLTTVTLLR